MCSFKTTSCQWSDHVLFQSCMMAGGLWDFSSFFFFRTGWQNISTRLTGSYQSLKCMCRFILQLNKSITVQLLDTLSSLKCQHLLCLCYNVCYESLILKRNETTSITCNNYILISIQFQGTLQGMYTKEPSSKKKSEMALMLAALKILFCHPHTYYLWISMKCSILWN